jgi:undecaprenyl pyrophosphate phosphatase UppP
MPLINIVLMLIVVGVVLSLINRYIPMASSIKSILNVVVVVAVVVWLLQGTGLWGGLSTFRVGR